MESSKDYIYLDFAGNILGRSKEEVELTWQWREHWRVIYVIAFWHQTINSQSSVLKLNKNNTTKVE